MFLTEHQRADLAAELAQIIGELPRRTVPEHVARYCDGAWQAGAQRPPLVCMRNFGTSRGSSAPAGPGVSSKCPEV